MTSLIHQVSSANPAGPAAATTITNIQNSTESGGAISAVSAPNSECNRRGSIASAVRTSSRQRAKKLSSCDNATRSSSLIIASPSLFDTPSRRGSRLSQLPKRNSDALSIQSSQDWNSPSSQWPHSDMLSSGQTGMDNFACLTTAKSAKRLSGPRDPGSVGSRSPPGEVGSPPAVGGESDRELDRSLEQPAEVPCLDTPLLDLQSDPQSTGARDARSLVTSEGKSTLSQLFPWLPIAGLDGAEAARSGSSSPPDPKDRASIHSAVLPTTGEQKRERGKRRQNTAPG